MDQNGNRPKYAGEKMELGGVEYVVPALSLRQAKELWPKLLELETDGTRENAVSKLSTASEIIHAAMTRNYPEMTIAQVEDLVDMANFKRIIAVVSATQGIALPGPRPAAGTASVEP